MGRFSRLVLVFFASGVMAACAQMPRLNTLMGPNYSPMTSDVAVMAAPETPGALVLYCRVTRGAARFGESWRDFTPVDFEVPRDGRVNVPLAPVRGEGVVTFQAWFDGAGQKMLFCPVIEGPPDQKISCASLYVLDEDLEAGIKRTFDIPRAVEGGAISCAKDVSALRN